MRSPMNAAAVVLLVLAVTGLVLGTNARWRPRLAVVMPLVLGAACATAGTVLAVSAAHADLTARMLFGLEGTPGLLRTASATAAAVAAAAVLFRVEGRLTGWWARARAARRLSAGAPSFFGVDLPGRSESMRGVAAVAGKPRVFLGLSGWSAVMEEYFYRGVFLLGFAGIVPLAVLLPSQAAWYGLNHLAFGVPALLGKTLLGAALGVAAVWGGVLPAMLAHAVYQLLVYRQFPARATAAGGSLR
jgi:Type II CAAX prenyl endopeptidase Rce1-like